MESLLARASVFTGHSYVVDYTEPEPGVATDKNHCGVEVTDIRPGREHFQLVNDCGCPHVGLSLEHVPEFSRNKNCEALLLSRGDAASGRPWLLFVELKYCHPAQTLAKSQRKVADKTKEALPQLLRSFDVLSNKGVDKTTHRVYANVHLPWMSQDVPFDNFVLSHEWSLRFEKRGIHLHRAASLIIVDASHLIEP